MIDQYSEYMKCVKKVIGLDNLRKNYGRYDQRRELLSSYDLFLADDRIIPMLRSALGNKFIERKKFPVPLKLTKKEVLPLAVKRAVEATYMYQTRGTSMSVRAGNTGMPVDELVENFEAIVNGVAEKIPKKWKNILNISIKTTNSIALPFYSKRPDELAELEDIVEKTKEEKGIDRADVSKKRKGGEANEDHDDESSPAINVDKSSKSPLLRALKKQKSDGKKAEPKDKLDVDKSIKKEKKKKVRKESDVSDIVENSRKGDSKNVTTKNDSTPATKAKKKKRADSDVSEAEKLSTKDSKKQKTPKTEEKRAKTKSKATPAKEEIDTTKAENKPADGNFVASKKFNGAKKGYVFKKGAKGVGYYKDTPPVVDKAVLAALARSASNGRGGRRQNTPKSSAKKRRGRR